jgi:hypothetical protein
VRDHVAAKSRADRAGRIPGVSGLVPVATIRLCSPSALIDSCPCKAAPRIVPKSVGGLESGHFLAALCNGSSPVATLQQQSAATKAQPGGRERDYSRLARRKRRSMSVAPPLCKQDVRVRVSRTVLQGLLMPPQPRRQTWKAGIVLAAHALRPGADPSVVRRWCGRAVVSGCLCGVGWRAGRGFARRG